MIDPGAKAAAAAAAAAATGGAVEGQEGKADVGKGLTVARDEYGREQWPWMRVVDVLSLSLFSPSWEIRHGAAMGLRDIIKTQGRGFGRVVGYPSSLNRRHNASSLLTLSHSLLSLLALDRFGDYNSDQVVAPVRETAGQTLASVMVHLDEDGVRVIHEVLVAMVRQSESGRVKEKGYAWEVRHAGLLGLKYEVAVRGDLVAKKENAKEETQEEHGASETRVVKTEPIPAEVQGVKTEAVEHSAIPAVTVVWNAHQGESTTNIKQEEPVDPNVELGQAAAARKGVMLKEVVDAAVLGCVLITLIWSDARRHELSCLINPADI